MADCVQIIRENSQAFFYNLKTTNLILKNMTRRFLLENGGSILCLETPDVDVTKVLLAQVLMNFKKDTALKENLNEILFTNFSHFITIMTSGQNKDFLKNFPDLLVCILDNEHELNKPSHILESWMINIIKVNRKKIIFIVKNPKHMEKFMINNEMANNFKLKLDKLWKQNEITSNNEAICEVGNNLVNIEPTSARALDECTDGNLKEEESSGKSSSHGEATTKEADLKNSLQPLGVKELDAVNKDGNTQLHLAARDGKTEIVESLLVHGAKKDVQNNDGKTALHFAAEKGHSAIVQVLLEHGFNVNAIENKYYYWTPLHYACCYHNDAHLIEILLKFGVEMEKKDNIGRTALHWASENGHSAVVNSLLKNGADINAQNNEGNTPLHFATSSNQQEVVLIFLQHGALLNIKNKKQQNALNVARSCRRTEIIKILENHK